MGGYVWPIGRPIDQRGRQVDEKGENKVLKEATRMRASERAFTGGREKKGKQKEPWAQKKWAFIVWCGRRPHMQLGYPPQAYHSSVWLFT